jgi:hypothetical protein
MRGNPVVADFIKFRYISSFEEEESCGINIVVVKKEIRIAPN